MKNRQKSPVSAEAGFCASLPVPRRGRRFARAFRRFAKAVRFARLWCYGLLLQFKLTRLRNERSVRSIILKTAIDFFNSLEDVFVVIPEGPPRRRYRKFIRADRSRNFVPTVQTTARSKRRNPREYAA